jgi:thioredoxin-like negative regulator of GroEL
MAGISLVIVLQHAILAADPASYEVAFKDAQTRNRPLMVLIGTPWCPGCQTMKAKLLPEMARQGRLDSVSYATINADEEPELASQLMRGSGIPQLIIFSKKPDGHWHREQITGEADEKGVEKLITRAVAAHEATMQTAGGGN